ncbi:GntR family transcriptional regulator [Alicyclobacillus dauci]|uniref:GntR family transcriptional regulator n=1 Tax=Alicyclobacillus dauci TaxID=1475485 RepID=A0ABY6Z0H3_9BACL|nr:GntR family transcriptional regulator [Alicyclobacillus dauci]WAH36033.1 GntR family transcriptional regulator [Alicyclobacillus dauci]
MIDRGSDIPIYQQLKDWMMNQIEQGVWKEGDTLEPEREMASRLGVNRLTLRQALSELAAEGWLNRQRGRGTFVTCPKIQHPLQRLTSFTQDISALGMKPGSRVLKMEIREATDVEATMLHLGAHAHRVIELKRLRLADLSPISVETAILPFEKCRALTEVSFQDLHSLYTQLRSRCGVEFSHASQTIESGAATEDIAELLKIRVGVPVLRMERTTFDSCDEPVEWVTSYYRADRYRFRVELPVD